MIDSGLMKIELNIAQQLVVTFLASAVENNRGIIYQEKNFEKNLYDLTSITLFKDEKVIVLRQGNFFLTLKCESGNLDRFVGDYKISLFGNSGELTIKPYDETEKEHL